MYWPGMSADIENMVAKCSICLKYRNQNQKEPLMPHETPDRPWQKLGTDIFELYSKSYLIIVDYYSKYTELCLLRDKTSQSVITSMKSVFARHGIPDEVIADNMPFSSKECIQFAQEWGFEINTSSPRYPQSNGMSERTIQTVKNLLKKAEDDGNDPYIALLEYRNTPVSGLQESPAQLLMSRMLKSKLPTVQSLLQPRVPENVREKLKQRTEKQREYYNRGAKPLPQIKEDDTVRIRKGKTWEPAVVTAKHSAPRSFIVTTPEGRVYRRNRRHLLPTAEPRPEITGPDYDDDDLSPATSTNAARVTPRVDHPPQTPPRRTSGRTVRLPERFRRDYVIT